MSHAVLQTKKNTSQCPHLLICFWVSSNIRNKDNKRLTEYKYLNKKEDKVHAGVKWDIKVPQGEKTKEQEREQGE